MINTDVTISGGGYEARFRSDIGANCYSLVHIPSGASLLRTPRDEKELFSEIFLFGNAILFPPNRIKGASFEFEGRSYVFPMNEPSTGCHLHGSLYKTPFEISEIGESFVRFTYSAAKGEYLGFPHAFTINRTYQLDESGMTETVEAVNDSEENMPFMLAFHTTLNVPFDSDSDGENCYLKMPVGKEHLRNEKYIPTCEYIGGRERENNLSSGNYRIYDSAVSAFYESSDNMTVVVDRATGRKLVYSSSEEYKYRMLWRKNGAKYVVTEPQTAAIDCFHLEAPAEEKGLIVVAPKTSVKLYTKFYIE